MCNKNSCIRETPNLLTAADCSTNIFVSAGVKKRLMAFFGGGWGHPEHSPVFRALLETTDPHQKVDSIHAKMRTLSTLMCSASREV